MIPNLPSRKLYSLLAIAVLVFSIACTGSGSNGETEPTATPIRSANSELRRSPGVFSLAADKVLWVTESEDILIEAREIERAHPDILAGQSITLDSTESGPAAFVNDDESVVALSVRTSGGSGGVALVRSDGYKMTLHLYGDSSATVGSIKFMPEIGFTLLNVGDGAGSRVIAFDNYGQRQFVLPVSDSVGTLRYSPGELDYLVIDRRPLEQELELVPFDEPGETTLFRPSDTSEEANDLYRSLSAAISSWE